MQAEILMIGTELLLGQIEDTNASYMGRVLAEAGINLYQKTTVGDNPTRIKDALRGALERSDVVLCSGGLGPTEDDITRECVAEVLDRPMEYHQDIFEHIEMLFARYRLPITENNKKQAMVPAGAQIIPNPNGTAPGLLVDDPKGIVICMPGVPRELKAMLNDQVIPWVRDRFGISGLIHYRVLKVCGVGESRVDEAMGDLMATLENPKIGVLANPAAVRIRISARAESIGEAERLIDEVDAQVRDRLPGLVMGVDDETLEGVVNSLLAERGWRLAVLETASGGMLAQRLVSGHCSQFAGGKVLPEEHWPSSSLEHAVLDLAKANLVEFAANCSLAVVSDSDASRTLVQFVSPDGERLWEFGRAGRDEVMQLRTSIISLEYVRRHLTGVADEAHLRS